MNAVLEYINWMGKGFVGFAGQMLLQSSVLIIILLIVDLLLRKKVRAVLRYWLWMLVLVKLVLPIWLSSPVSIGHLVGNELQGVKISMPEIAALPRVTEPLPIEADNKDLTVMPQKSVSAPAAIQPKIMVTPISWQGVVFVVWAAVVVVMVLLLLQRVVFVCGLVAQAKEASPLMNDTLKYCCGQMGMKGTIGLKVSANATSPAVCGLYRPVILVPENLEPRLGGEHLRTVLLHELAHIKRGDLWVNLVQTLLQIIYFYNPLLWLANAMIRRVREQAVDEAVLVAMGERAQQYPETLLNVAKLAFKRPVLSLRLIGVVESKSALSGRIKHILSRPIPKSAKLGIWGLAVVLIFGAVLLPMAKANSSNESFDVPKEFVGHWKGQSKIIVNWTKQRWLDIDIEIKPDGTVSGQVGDSQLENAVFKLRDWLARKFNPKSNWMVRGDLIGPIIKNESIEREYINLLFDDIGTDGKITGGFHTSGWDMGNKKTMIMSGTAMLLKKMPMAIAFEITKSDFLQGDLIEIIELSSTSDQLKTGEKFTVKGKYSLASHDEALLHIYATNGEISSEQGPTIKRGSGEFSRTFIFLKAGDLHLSFYPASGGNSFGGIYFAQKTAPVSLHTEQRSNGAGEGSQKAAGKNEAEEPKTKAEEHVYRPLKPSKTAETYESNTIMKLGQWLLMYADDHSNRYPETLQELKQYADVDGKSYFEWVTKNVEYIGKGVSPAEAPDRIIIIAYDKTMLATNPDGTNVLYNDAHVEFKKAEWLKSQLAALKNSPAGWGEDKNIGGKLEFGIAPKWSISSRDESRITKEEINLYTDDLLKNGPDAGKGRNEQYVWYKVKRNVRLSTVVSQKYNGDTYVLVYNDKYPLLSKPETMGMRPNQGWGLRKVYATRDNNGRPAVGFDFDKKGGELFYELTRHNVYQMLAIIVDGEVVSAPFIQTALQESGIITGDFAQDEVEKMAAALQKGMPPVKTDVQGEGPNSAEILSTLIKVVNEDGKPVEGAVITMDGLRNKWGSYIWDSERYGEAPEVATNAEGIARVTYPKYTREKMKTEAISFRVNHPEYCPVRPYDYRVDGKSPPVVLSKGANIKVSAYIGSKDNVIRDIYPQVSIKEVGILEGSSWTKNDDGSLTTKQISAGPHYLRLVYFPKNEGTYFSDTVSFEAEKGKTYQFNLELKPGGRLEGKLDSSVPRPVQNGRVVVNVCQADEQEKAGYFMWRTLRNIKNDGTFVIESLPPGIIEIIALCDGFISRNPPGRREQSIGIPQTIQLEDGTKEIEIAVEPTATCEVKVVNEKGEPVKGAKVGFWPNVEWCRNAATIFAQCPVTSEEFLRKGAKLDLMKKQVGLFKNNDFVATTDEKGVAIVRNLPGYSQDFAVIHPDYELPAKTAYDSILTRQAWAELLAGETTKVTVTVQKKGKEFLGEEKSGDLKADVRIYQVNRMVSDFPNKEDLSTPEAAYATCKRISVSGEKRRWADVSVKEIAKRFKGMDEKNNVNFSAELGELLLNTKILEVRIGGNEACVIGEYPLNRDGTKMPQSIEYEEFVLEDGKWLYAGKNSRFDTIEGLKNELGEGNKVQLVSQYGLRVNPNSEDMQLLKGQALLRPAGYEGQAGETGISGIVVNEQGAPIEGVLIDVFGCSTSETDKKGFFQLSGFDSDRKTTPIKFSKDGYSPRFIIKQSLGLKDMKVILNSKTYFEGRVIDLNSKPATNVSIRAITGTKYAEDVMIPEISTETISDSNGSYRLYVQADTYNIQARADEGVASLQGVVISKNQAKQLDIKLGESVTFRAKVVDSQTGKPVKGVRLSHWQYPGIEGTSDSNGLIEIKGMVPRKFNFEVEAKQYCRWWSEQCVSDWNHYNIYDKDIGWQRNFDNLDFNLKVGMEPVKITVERGVVIRGKVLDPDGKPVEGATVAPALSGIGNSLTGDTRFSVETKADGSFEMIVPASKDAKYNLIAHDGKLEQWRNWANGVLEPIKTKPGDVMENVVIKLTRGGTVRGKVINSSGNPMPNHQVHSHSFDKLENRYYDPTTRTDGNGNFEISFIRPGKHYIQAYPFWLHAEEAPDKATKIVTVEAGEVIEGIELIADEHKSEIIYR